MKKLLIKISVIIMFIITSAQTNDDIKKLESDIKKAATDIAETFKIEVAIKGKKLKNFFINNDLTLISENGSREYKFREKTYEIINGDTIIQSGSWKVHGLLKNQIRLISDNDKKKYYLKKISKKPWIYNYDKRPGSEGAQKEILHIKFSSKFSEIVSKETFSSSKENSKNLSKQNSGDKEIKKESVSETKKNIVTKKEEKISYNLDYYKDYKNLSIFKCQKSNINSRRLAPIWLSGEGSTHDGLNQFKAVFMNQEKKNEFQNVFDDYIVIYTAEAGILEGDPKFFAKHFFKRNEKNLNFSSNNFTLDYPLFNMSKLNSKSFFTFNASSIYWSRGKHKSPEDVLYSDTLSFYEFKYIDDNSFQKIISHMYFPSTHRSMNNLAYYFDNNYNGVNDHNMYDLITKIKNSVFKTKANDYVGINSYQTCNKIYVSENPKNLNNKKNIEAVIPKELIVKKDGVIYIKGNAEAFDTSPLEKCDLNATIWTNCKAAYEMSNAPPEIYNDLVEANNVILYRGEFKNNYPHGSGTLQFKDVTFTYVIFENGQLKKLTDYEGARAYQVDKYMKMLKANQANTYIAKPGYEICRSTWKQLISIRNTKSKNTPDYYKIDAFVETAFELMLTYKGTNALDTGNCEKLLSLAKN